ncbi:MAG: hypothetical protein CL678_03215 [Bdellovibrionaceae bacterium]|nr:hypothetical protein [Pseudobdellovibrionaceae bacterium]|tara:strand:- start:7338 stop:7931 length:594 start_codon:yes stop_codon:yes gene_type:complete
MKKQTLFTLVLLSSQLGYAAECLYSIDSKKSQIGWKAFKYSEALKAGVPGSFKKVAYKETYKPNLEKALQATPVEIDLQTVDTKNPGRDQTLTKSFFTLILGKKIKARFLKMKASKALVAIQLNKKTKTVEMKVKKHSENHWSLEGSIDLLADFGLKKQFESLHQACKGLHTGSDGISKTWTDVELHAEVYFKKKCS